MNDILIRSEKDLELKNLVIRTENYLNLIASEPVTPQVRLIVELRDSIFRLKESYEEETSYNMNDQMETYQQCIRCGVIDEEKEKHLASIGAGGYHSIEEMVKLLADEVVKLRWSFT